MKKKIISSLLIIIILISIFQINNSFSYAIGDYKIANLIIGKNKSIPVFELGEEVRVGIPIKNIGELSAENLIISLDTSDLESFPFEMEDMTIKKRISLIHGHDHEIANFNL